MKADTPNPMGVKDEADMDPIEIPDFVKKALFPHDVPQLNRYQKRLAEKLRKRAVKNSTKKRKR